MGNIAKNSKQYEKGIEYFNEARWLLADKNADILIALAACFSGKNMPEKAERLLGEAGAINPNHSSLLKPMLKLRLAKLSRISSPSEKKALEKEIFNSLNQLINSGNRERNYVGLFAEYNLKLSDPLIDSAKFDQVERLLSDLNQGDNLNESSIRYQVLTLMRRRKLNEASQIVEKASSLFPGSPTIAELRSQLRIELGSAG